MLQAIDVVVECCRLLVLHVFGQLSVFITGKAEPIVVSIIKHEAVLGDDLRKAGL